MRLAVQEALSLMADAFKDLNESNMKIMEALLMEAIDKVTQLFICYTVTLHPLYFAFTNFIFWF
jgi:hypothetical protein